MRAKFTFVGFLPPIEISFVFQTPAVFPFNKKKSNLKRLSATTLIFVPFFPHPVVTVAVCISNNFT